MSVRRRTFLQLAAGLSVAVCRAFSADQPARQLKAAVAPCGLRVGVQAFKSLLEQPGVGSFVSSNFNLLSDGLSLKWNHIHPEPDRYDFNDSDWMLRFAADNQMLFHGHNLCWNSANPAWLSKPMAKSTARRVLVEHIKTVAGRYAGRIESWDVVNEPIDLHSSRADGLREGPWLNSLGPEYIDIAFDTIRSTDPATLRVLNIYGVEQDFGHTDKTRENSLALLKTLIGRGVAIQAVGLESHLLTSAPVQSEKRDRFIKEVKSLGLQLVLTELDVNDTTTRGPNETRDSVVAEYYARYLQTVLPETGASRVIFWTATDRANWMDTTHGPYIDRPDGQKHRPGLLDSNLTPKNAYGKAFEALQGACKTHTRI